MSQLNWTDAQWQVVNDTVKTEFGKASVATAIKLRARGPLPGGVETVRNERLLLNGSKLKLDTDHSAADLKLVNLTVHVELSNEQVSDQTLSNALLAFGRAANVLAQQEDRIVFDGFDPTSPTVNAFVANTVREQKGLADAKERLRFDIITDDGPSLIAAVVAAIKRLEDNSHPGPFACVLGNRLHRTAYEPAQSLAITADTIAPILNGPVVRSGQAFSSLGFVIPFPTDAVDIVVGTEPKVDFLQRTDKGRFLFRVYERFVLRLRDRETPPVEGFLIPDLENKTFAESAVRAARRKTVADAAAAVAQKEIAVAQAAQAVELQANAVVQAGRPDVSGKGQNLDDAKVLLEQRKMAKAVAEADLKAAEAQKAVEDSTPRTRAFVEAKKDVADARLALAQAREEEVRGTPGAADKVKHAEQAVQAALAALTALEK